MRALLRQKLVRNVRRPELPSGRRNEEKPEIKLHSKSRLT